MNSSPGWQHPLMGISPPFVRMTTIIDQFARSSAPVLLVGETGTGKEVLARTIHEQSPRHAHPFLGIHCGGSPAAIQIELFGDPGSPLGDEPRDGLFVRADGGTLFLDEIDLLDLSLQVHLDVALQRLPGKFWRPGGAKQIDVRIVAATNQDLARMCREALFRSHLYSQLNVLTVSVPSLRERGGEDIQLLALYFLELAASRHNRHVRGFTDEAIRALATYPWPGNEQELHHVVELAVSLMSSGELITTSDL